jgi:hypothetical protein
MGRRLHSRRGSVPDRQGHRTGYRHNTPRTRQPAPPGPHCFPAEIRHPAPPALTFVGLLLNSWVRLAHAVVRRHQRGRPFSPRDRAGPLAGSKPGFQSLKPSLEPGHSTQDHNGFGTSNAGKRHPIRFWRQKGSSREPVISRALLPPDRPTAAKSHSDQRWGCWNPAKRTGSQPQVRSKRGRLGQVLSGGSHCCQATVCSCSTSLTHVAGHP